MNWHVYKTSRSMLSGYQWLGSPPKKHSFLFWGKDCSTFFEHSTCKSQLSIKMKHLMLCCNNNLFISFQSHGVLLKILKYVVLWANTTPNIVGAKMLGVFASVCTQPKEHSWKGLFKLYISTVGARSGRHQLEWAIKKWLQEKYM